MKSSQLTASLVHGNRRRARLLLYLLPLVLVAGGWGAVVYFKSGQFAVSPWREQDFTQYESVRLLQRYVSINTSYPTGNEIPGAEFLARELEKVGIEAHVERIGHRNANMWAILEGDERNALVLHNHIDVDPIFRLDQWQYPPFSGLLELPFIFGRGAFDMKSLAIAQLMILKKLGREGVVPRQSVIFLATGDEERDSGLGTRLLLHLHPELVERFDVVLTEGGAVEATDVDKVKFWGTETRQKLYVEMQVCSSNRGALEALQADLSQPEYFTRGHVDRLPDKVVEELRHYVATRERPDFKLRFESALKSLGGFNKLPFNVQAMMRHDLSAFPVVADPGGGYSMRLVLQLLPWEPVDDAWNRVLPGGLPGFSYSAEIPHPPIPVEGLEHEIFDHIGRHMGEAYPDFRHGPLFVPWAATDARFFRSAGVPAFGFSPFLILTGDANKITGPNERVVAPAFVDGVELYEAIVRSWISTSGRSNS